MAWTGVDDFESYADGNTLASLNGGTGWALAYVKVGGGNDWVVEADGALEGTLSAYHAPNNGTDTGVIRQLSATSTSGIYSFRARRSTNSSGGMYGGLRVYDSAWVLFWEFGAAGNLRYGHGDTPTTWGAYSADTTYDVDFEYDTSTDQVRIQVNGGGFGSWVNMYASSGTDGVRLISNDSTTAINRFDYLRDGTVTDIIGPFPVHFRT